MSMRVKRVSGWMLGLLVAAALVFGASVALVQPAQAMTCANDGWNTFGWQPDYNSCQTACWQVHDPTAQPRWNPITGCCSCLF